MTNLTHNFLYVFISILYMFRATSCSSSGESIVSIQHLVYVTLCRWPTQSDIYQMLYWYNWFSWWWARGCSIHVENWNKHIEKIVRQVGHLPTIITRCTVNETQKGTLFPWRRTAHRELSPINYNYVTNNTINSSPTAIFCWVLRIIIHVLYIIPQYRVPIRQYSLWDWNIKYLTVLIRTLWHWGRLSL